ncbi:hypothetical protein BP00DRAFT_241140 [Aspergillus indologenus CBS 114.80]|uniref:Uncharacterized protein n=1 Tax=Aspergillus indologenus CBS 114.80 TaxID=1450541 RepID=A0A2V5HXY1_9EURO|nr:hypothetical protein BP00DRAFT_241140 [Aspergillus indologenus CBS 114.80]
MITLSRPRTKPNPANSKHARCPPPAKHRPRKQFPIEPATHTTPSSPMHPEL